VAHRAAASADEAWLTIFACLAIVPAALLAANRSRTRQLR
jgi:hypothetical protein